ncbi:MAG: hypothetical protein AAGU75_00145 [Bacillota bacterium]
MENLKKQLRGDLFNFYLEASKIGYRPTLLLQIISRNEDITSIVKRLISKETDGYVKLYELERLDLSVENYVLNPNMRGYLVMKTGQSAASALLIMDISNRKSILNSSRYPPSSGINSIC